MNAAKASVAAGNQGKFWEMHDELFKISRNLAMEEIRKKAEEIGLDIKKFDADMASPETEKAVRADLERGRTVEVQGTPTMFINGKRVMNRSLEGMKAMVDEELKKKKGQCSRTRPDTTREPVRSLARALFRSALLD
jgi:protein-disulfide isomerase